MRILILSNFYPPADRGGWEQWAHEVAVAFSDRGHEIEVITSRYKRDEILQHEANIYRELYLDNDLNYYRPRSFFFELYKHDKSNAEVLARRINHFKPDLVFIWGMWQLNYQLAVLAEQLMLDKVAYYFCGYWPIDQDPHTAFWTAREANYLSEMLKKPARAIIPNLIRHQRSKAPEFRHVACVSQAVLDNLCDGGLVLPGARIIYGGIEIDNFPPRLKDNESGVKTLPVKMIYAGNFSAAKGVDTAIEAITILAQHYRPGEFYLSLVGKGHPDFESWIDEYVEKNSLGPYLKRLGWLKREDLLPMLADHDILLFPSRWQEPLARMMMEGLASGLALISTTTGGSKEILIDGENCLTFEAGDSRGLAIQVTRLLDDPELLTSLGLAGQEMARTKLTFQRMVNELELFCIDSVTGG